MRPASAEPVPERCKQVRSSSLPPGRASAWLGFHLWMEGYCSAIGVGCCVAPSPLLCPLRISTVSPAFLSYLPALNPTFPLHSPSCGPACTLRQTARLADSRTPVTCVSGPRARPSKEMRAMQRLRQENYSTATHSPRLKVSWLRTVALSCWLLVPSAKSRRTSSRTRAASSTSGCG